MKSAVCFTSRGASVSASPSPGVGPRTPWPCPAGHEAEHQQAGGESAHGLLDSPVPPFAAGCTRVAATERCECSGPPSTRVNIAPGPCPARRIAFGTRTGLVGQAPALPGGRWSVGAGLGGVRHGLPRPGRATFRRGVLRPSFRQVRIRSSRRFSASVNLALMKMPRRSRPREPRAARVWQQRRRQLGRCLAATLSPDPMVEAPCPPADCGTLTGQTEAAATLTVRETAGVGVTLSSVSMKLRPQSGEHLRLRLLPGRRPGAAGREHGAHRPARQPERLGRGPLRRFGGRASGDAQRHRRRHGRPRSHRLHQRQRPGASLSRRPVHRPAAGELRCARSCRLRSSRSRREAPRWRAASSAA